MDRFFKILSWSKVKIDFAKKPKKKWAVTELILEEDPLTTIHLRGFRYFKTMLV